MPKLSLEHLFGWNEGRWMCGPLDLTPYAQQCQKSPCPFGECMGMEGLHQWPGFVCPGRRSGQFRLQLQLCHDYDCLRLGRLHLSQGLGASPYFCDSCHDQNKVGPIAKYVTREIVVENSIGRRSRHELNGLISPYSIVQEIAQRTTLTSLFQLDLDLKTWRAAMFREHLQWFEFPVEALSGNYKTMADWLSNCPKDYQPPFLGWLSIQDATVLDLDKFIMEFLNERHANDAISVFQTLCAMFKVIPEDLNRPIRLEEMTLDFDFVRRPETPIHDCRGFSDAVVRVYLTSPNCTAWTFLLETLFASLTVRLQENDSVELSAKTKTGDFVPFLTIPNWCYWLHWLNSQHFDDDALEDQDAYWNNNRHVFWLLCARRLVNQSQPMECDPAPASEEQEEEQQEQEPEEQVQPQRASTTGAKSTMLLTPAEVLERCFPLGDTWLEERHLTNVLYRDLLEFAKRVKDCPFRDFFLIKPKLYEQFNVVLERYGGIVGIAATLLDENRPEWEQLVRLIVLTENNSLMMLSPASFLEHECGKDVALAAHFCSAFISDTEQNCKHPFQLDPSPDKVHQKGDGLVVEDTSFPFPIHCYAANVEEDILEKLENIHAELALAGAKKHVAMANAVLVSNQVKTANPSDPMDMTFRPDPKNPDRILVCDGENWISVPKDQLQALRYLQIVAAKTGSPIWKACNGNKATAIKTHIDNWLHGTQRSGGMTPMDGLPDNFYEIARYPNSNFRTAVQVRKWVRHDRSRFDFDADRVCELLFPAEQKAAPPASPVTLAPPVMTGPPTPIKQRSSFEMMLLCGTLTSGSKADERLYTVKERIGRLCVQTRMSVDCRFSPLTFRGDLPVTEADLMREIDTHAKNGTLPALTTMEGRRYFWLLLRWHGTIARLRNILEEWVFFYTKHSFPTWDWPGRTTPLQAPVVDLTGPAKQAEDEPLSQLLEQCEELEPLNSDAIMEMDEMEGSQMCDQPGFFDPLVLNKYSLMAKRAAKCLENGVADLCGIALDVSEHYVAWDMTMGSKGHPFVRISNSLPGVRSEMIFVRADTKFSEGSVEDQLFDLIKCYCPLNTSDIATFQYLDCPKQEDVWSCAQFAYAALHAMRKSRTEDPKFWSKFNILKLRSRLANHIRGKLGYVLHDDEDNFEFGDDDSFLGVELPFGLGEEVAVTKKREREDDVVLVEPSITKAAREDDGFDLN